MPSIQKTKETKRGRISKIYITPILSMKTFDWYHLTYWSIGHILSFVTPIIFLLLLYLILRLQSPKAQKGIILFIMILNVIQHVFKAYVYYPVYHGKFDIGMSFFCNLCGAQILLSPFIFLGKSKWLKDSLFVTGIISPIVSLGFITVTYGVSIFDLVFIRYFVAHTLLLATSALPVLLGLHTLTVKNCWKIGIFFIFLEVLVFVDEMWIVAYKNNWDWAYSYQFNYNQNKLFIYHSANSSVFNHTFLEGFQMKYIIDDGTCTYIPILYSAPFIYVFFLIISWITFRICYSTKLNGHYLAEKYPQDNYEEYYNY